MNRVNEILLIALKFEKGHIRRTQHILKVHGLVKLMSDNLKIDHKEKELLEIASILHDIGIKPTKDKGIESSLENQLKEVKIILKELKEKYKISDEEEKRIFFLIENHHNYNKLDDLSHQILIEADLIINIFEKDKKNSNDYFKFIRTDIGKELFNSFFC